MQLHKNLLSMADDHFGHHGSAGNWWDSSSRTRYESGASSSAAMGSFSWPEATVKSTSSGEASGGGLVDPNLHLMGLEMSSSQQPLDWNQTLIRSGGERGFCLDDDDSGVYGNSSSTIIAQGLGESVDHHHHHHHHQQQQQQQSEYQYNYVPPNYSYGMNSDEFWRHPSQTHIPLQFSNNAPFWNASAAATNDVVTFPTSLHSHQVPPPSFGNHDKPIKMKVGEVGEDQKIKKSGNNNEAASKRPRNESPLPPFKVRKEKMGDRITALQQLVSPFGKTDTASVLSEAIEYIKFLHEQVSVLSTPYMKSGAPTQHQQGMEEGEGAKQDLRSRGLCLVPVSSTFPVTHETTVDFWSPSFGGSFR